MTSAAAIRALTQLVIEAAISLEEAPEDLAAYEWYPVAGDGDHVDVMLHGYDPRYPEIKHFARVYRRHTVRISSSTTVMVGWNKDFRKAVAWIGGLIFQERRRE